MPGAMTETCEKIRQIFEAVYSQQTREMIAGISNTMQTFADIAANIKIAEKKIPDEFIYAVHKLSIIMALRKAGWQMQLLI